MAKKALFISIDDLKKKSIIDGNVDSDKLLQFVEVAQDTDIQNYLGGNLYAKLQELIVDGTINDVGNADYKTLLSDYVKPMLIWYSQAAILPFMLFQVKNGGIYKHSSDNGESISKSELDYIIQRTRNNAEFYTKRYLDYMCAYSTLYPEYISNKNGEMYPDKDVNYSGGWLI
jgi:hypothetical protein